MSDARQINSKQIGEPTQWGPLPPAVFATSCGVAGGKPDYSDEVSEDQIAAIRKLADSDGAKAERRSRVPTFNFNDLLELCIRHSNERGIIAKAGQIKFWIKNGGLSAKRPGRGKAATFRLADLWRVAVLNEMGKLGIAPSAAVKLLGTFAGGPDVAKVHFVRGNITLTIDLTPYEATIRELNGQPVRETV